MGIESYVATVGADRAALPPSQVESMTDAPRLLTDPEVLQARRSFVDGAMQFLRKAAKPFAVTFGLTTEFIGRLDDFTQVTVATTFGKIPLKEYPQYASDVIHGRRTVTGSEWMRLMIGQERWESIKDSSVIPGWTKKIVVSDAYLGQVEKTVPKVRVEQLANLGVELIVSPFAAFGWLPKNFFTATKVGRVLRGPQIATGVRFGFDPATSAVTYPLRAFGSALFSKGPVAALLMHPRDPTEVYTGGVRSAIINGAEELHGAAESIGEAIIPLARKYRRGLIRNRNGMNQDELAGVWKHLFLDDQALNPRQYALVDEIMTTVVDPWYQALMRNGHTKIKASVGGRVRSTLFNPMPGARAKHKPYLREFIGSVHQWRFSGAERGEAAFFARNRIDLPLRKGGPLPYDPALLQNFQMDPFHAVEQVVSTFARKSIMEAQVKVKIAGPGGRMRSRWSPRGFLNQYGVPSERWDTTKDAFVRRAHWDPTVEAARQEILQFGPSKFQYHLGKLRDASGHRAGKVEIQFDNVMDRFFANWDQWMQQGLAGPGRVNRVNRYLMARVGGKLGIYGQPRQTRLASIAGLMTQNVIVATLGLNLGSAIKNTSQLLNTAAKEGVPATMQGVFRMALAHQRLGGQRGAKVLLAAGGRSEILADIRNDLRLRAAYRRITYDDIWNLGIAGRTRFVDWMLRPFNAVENVMRGVAADVAAERALKQLRFRTPAGRWKQGVETTAEWKGLKQAERDAIVAYAREGAIDTNFLYGLAGRSHLMMHPVARAGFALQSYSWKEAEFIARSWAKDGSAPIRLWAMHGWLLNLLDQTAGINAENWLGWGFLPPSGHLPQSPIVKTIGSLQAVMAAAGTGDYSTMDLEVNRLRSGMREIFRMIGLSPDDHVQTQAILGGLANAGLLPVPVVAIAKSARAAYAFQTGALESGSGRSWIPVTRADAIKSAFFTLHAQAEDQRLRLMERSTRGQVGRTLDKRTNAFIEALGSQDGTAVLEAARALYSYIPVNIPLAPGAWGFAGDTTQFWPHPEMIEQRIQNAIARRMISGPVKEMFDSGWAFEILWQPYINGALQAIERGAVRGFGK